MAARRPVPSSRGDLLLVFARLLGLRGAQDALRERETELSVRAGADPQVVAEQPVIEVVPAARALARVCRDFVLPIAGFGQQRSGPRV